MNIIACVDDGYGILFNKRRVSRDKEIVSKIAELVGESKLWISEYSKPLFENCTVYLEIDDFILEKAVEGEYCFVETQDISSYKEKIKTVTLFCFNRKYPSDKRFPKELLENAQLVKREEFRGNSHDKITMEVYSVEK